ncbi:MAG TPA: hypothetical protein VHE33_20605 [Acidobacteriaceae bacterium]|nr:hypothetical protein [Acidobacteriaceae bacterium]
MAAVNAGPDLEDALTTDERWALVKRIASSPHLKSSPRLCEFLFYISKCAIRNAPEDATEQQIGIRVFGRSPGYNSSEDSIVRTHARLLRQKLASYFSEDGAAEQTVLEIPKGHYFPVFHNRNTEAPPVLFTPSLTGEMDVQDLPHPAEDKEPSRRRAIVATVVLVLLAVGIAGLALWRPWRASVAAPTAVDVFWHPFLSGDPPLVIYSNALFQGTSTQGLRYAPPDPTGPPFGDDYVDTYTGIGELNSVYTLTQLFDAHHATFLLKRSLLVTWDVAQSRNLVFVGSRAENPSLRVLPSTTDFTMMATPDSAGIVNHHPLPGEPPVYLRPERPLNTDYAILALQPGVQPGRLMLVFSGLTTFGTQAAVDFVCDPDSVAGLLKKISGPKGEIRPFEAVLQTTVGGGVPFATRLVTIRIH